MLEMKKKRIETLISQREKAKERAEDANYLYGDGSKSYKSAEMRVAECTVLINFHQKFIELHDQQKAKAEFERTNCRKCELFKDGKCLTGIENILECKETRERLGNEESS